MSINILIMEQTRSFEHLKYQPGFENHFSTESVEGALPIGRNSPQVCAHGLYAEQLSGTSFTQPRRLNFRTWYYRMQPSVTHSIAVFSHSLRHRHVLTTCVRGAEQRCWRRRSLRLLAKPTLKRLGSCSGSKLNK